MFEAEGAQRIGKPIYRQKKAIAALFLTILMAVVHFAGWATANHYWAYILGLLVVGMGDTMYEKAKNRTKGRLVAGNMHFSLNQDVISNPGNLMILSLGGIVYKMFPPMSGDEGTLVVRKELVEKNGENAFIVHGDISRVEYSELPLAAKKEIHANGSYSEPYYMSRIPKYDYINESEYKEKLSKIEEITEKNKSLEDRNKELEEMLKKRFKNLRSAARTGEKMRHPSMRERIKSKVLGSEEEKREGR